MMKNQFNLQFIRNISQDARKSRVAFDHELFLREASNNLDKLEMKQRIALIGDSIWKAAGNDFNRFFQLYADILAAENEATGDFWKSGIRFAPAAWVVEHRGTDHFDLSMQLIREITKRYTGEFAIRPFIEKYPEQTLQEMQLMSLDSNEHLRRLASEGSRSRLPWGKKLGVLIKNPELILPILQNLRSDSSKYVQRSVANHLNDISKDNPSVFYAVIREWKKSGHPSTEWIIKHALRNEIKKGTPEALELQGINQAAAVSASLNLSSPRVKIGGSLELKLKMVSHEEKPGKMVADFNVRLVKKGGKVFNKVFKWKTFVAEPGVQYNLSKKLHFKQLSTRTYYPGEHVVSVLVNGQPADQSSFYLQEN